MNSNLACGLVVAAFTLSSCGEGSSVTGTPTDIAQTALFLASDESSFITGQWISPNGGLVMC